MKRLVYSFGALLLGVGLAGFSTLWALGHRDHGLQRGKAIRIDRPAQAIWPYLARPDQVKRWTGGIDAITPLSGTGTEVGAKQKVLARGRPDEAQVTLEQTFTLVDPPHRLGYTLEARQGGMGFVQRVEQRLDEKNGGTTFTVITDTELEGFWPRLFAPLVLASASQKTERDLRALKALVEQETVAPPPAPPPASPADTASARSPGL